MENNSQNTHWLHQVANQVMGLNGIVSLLRLGKLSFDATQAAKLQENIHALMKLIEEARRRMQRATSTLDAVTDYEVTYISQLQPSLKEASRDVLDDIRVSAERNNSPQGITGCLLYYQGYFLQRLEGPQPAVLQLLGKIMLDVRHSQVTVLSSGPLAHRSQRRWHAMQCLDAADDPELMSLLSPLVTRTHHQLRSAESLSLVNLVIETMARSGVDLQQ